MHMRQHTSAGSMAFWLGIPDRIWRACVCKATKQNYPSMINAYQCGISTSYPQDLDTSRAVFRPEESLVRHPETNTCT